MRISSPWSVDQLAASRLLDDLGIEVTETRLDMVARHFAGYRDNMSNWSAQHVQSQILLKLETTPRAGMGRDGDDWNRGFCFAEQQVATMTINELLQRDTAPERSRGQILRSMLRHARSLR